jgi:hypothetical protein
MQEGKRKMLQRVIWEPRLQAGQDGSVGFQDMDPDLCLPLLAHRMQLPCLPLPRATQPAQGAGAALLRQILVATLREQDNVCATAEGHELKAAMKAQAQTKVNYLLNHGEAALPERMQQIMHAQLFVGSWNSMARFGSERALSSSGGPALSEAGGHLADPPPLRGVWARHSAPGSPPSPLGDVPAMRAGVDTGMAPARRAGTVHGEVTSAARGRAGVSTQHLHHAQAGRSPLRCPLPPAI